MKFKLIVKELKTKLLQLERKKIKEETFQVVIVVEESKEMVLI